MFEALGRAAYRRRWWVIATAVAFLAVAAGWGTGVFGRLSGGGFDDPGSDSYRAAQRAAAELGRDDADVLVLYSQPGPDRRRPGVPAGGHQHPGRAAVDRSSSGPPAGTTPRRRRWSAPTGTPRTRCWCCAARTRSSAPTG